MYGFTLKRTGWAVATLLVLLVGCKKSTDPVTPANQECQLQSTLASDSDGVKQTTTYTYNGNGQLTSSIVSLSTNNASTVTTTTNTYTYDTAGNLISAASRRGNSTNTVTYEYTGGRLTKQSSPTGAITYVYDGSGRVVTYTNTYSASSQPVVESYSFTSGILSGGAITFGNASLTVVAANGRIANISFPDGSRYRYTYDANGYLIKEDELDAKSVVQSYNTYEYGTAAYQSANVPPVNAPVINLYGSTGLPVKRVVYYNGDGSIDEDYSQQYQVNSKGYLTSLSVTDKLTNSGTYTATTTYTYTNCQ